MSSGDLLHEPAFGGDRFADAKQLIDAQRAVGGDAGDTRGAVDDGARRRSWR